MHEFLRSLGLVLGAIVAVIICLCVGWMWREFLRQPVKLFGERAVEITSRRTRRRFTLEAKKLLERSVRYLSDEVIPCYQLGEDTMERDQPLYRRGILKCVTSKTPVELARERMIGAQKISIPLIKRALANGAAQTPRQLADLQHLKLQFQQMRRMCNRCKGHTYTRSWSRIEFTLSYANLRLY